MTPEEINERAKALREALPYDKYDPMFDSTIAEHLMEAVIVAARDAVIAERKSIATAMKSAAEKRMQESVTTQAVLYSWAIVIEDGRY